MHIHTCTQALKEAEVAKKLSLNDELLEREKQMKRHHADVQSRLKLAEKEASRQKEEASNLAAEAEELEDRVNEVHAFTLKYFVYVYIYVHEFMSLTYVQNKFYIYDGCMYVCMYVLQGGKYNSRIRISSCGWR